jgi:tetratricopeptide (TPR) repeat protein
VEIARFIFWTAMKTLSLAFLGLLAAKAVGGLKGHGPERLTKRLAGLRAALYAAILVLVGLGAVTVGYDVAAENYAWTSQKDLEQGRIAKAYANALRAVELRPAVLDYWQGLSKAKFALGQYSSLLADEPILRSLSGEKLDEQDAYRLALVHYSLAQYDATIAITQRLIAQNRMYAAPYVLEGYAYTAEKKYPQAERTFLAILQIFPSLEAAVEGLAHVHFLQGNLAAALSVLNQTSKFPFPPEARERFEALKALYAQ